MKGPADFEKAMHQIYVRAKKEAGYNATIYLRMLHDRHGLGTAKALINSPKVSDGYTHLYERGRLDLTVEALIVENPRWHTLFTREEVETARDRLKKYGYLSVG
tara:strand:+ start:136 stop:447 length:312 start_codon:yes stop_codon:yes gene_type:complete